MNRHLHSILTHTADSAIPLRDVDDTLLDFEGQAWEVYRQIARTMAIKQPVGALDKFLSAHILPGFLKLGWADEFIRSLIALAAGPWEALASVPDRVVGLYPHMRNDLDEVRQGLIIQADKRMDSYSDLSFLTPEASYDLVQQSTHPVNLYKVLEEIATPWIILPRAYRTLHRDQAHYLPAYLEMIENETNEEALHIFTRIAIEFLANFCIRFADVIHAKEKVVRLVTAGYSAMYWKSLRTPPRGYEDVRVFEHYISWLKYSDSHSSGSDDDPSEGIQTMEALKKVLFSNGSNRCHDHTNRPFKSRFLVALRHGCLGIDSSVRYFASQPPDIGLPFDKGMAWGTLLFDLKALFDLIVDRYHHESERTQYYIREFIFQLENAYALTLFDVSGTGINDLSSLKFVQSKVTTMIHQLQKDLARDSNG